MATIVVVGSGICGMAAALMLARDGHEVTMVERDAPPLPADVEEAWHSWDRRGVGQFRMAHLLLASGTATLSAELPDVIETLEASGGLQFNVVKSVLGRTGIGTILPEDDRFDMMTGRRPSIEWALATVLLETAATQGLPAPPGPDRAQLLELVS